MFIHLNGSLRGIIEDEKYWLILLNMPLHSNQLTLFPEIWNNAEMRICVDGGLEVFKRFHENSKNSSELVAPNLVCGDLDSIENGTLTWLKSTYGENETVFKVLNDQSKNDFEKTLRFIVHDCEDFGFDIHLLAMNCFGGRLDHSLAAIHVAGKLSEELEYKLKLSMINEKSMAMIIAPRNETTVVLDDCDSCGLIPAFGPVELFTKGLKWNLDEEVLEMGKFISSSNRPVSDRVLIKNESENAVLWTQELNE